MSFLDDNPNLEILSFKHFISRSLLTDSNCTPEFLAAMIGEDAKRNALRAIHRWRSDEFDRRLAQCAEDNLHLLGGIT